MAKAKRATAEVVDFTNVKEGGRFQTKHYPAGDYPAKITAVEDAVKKDDKSVKMWLFTIQVKSGSYPYYCNRMAANQAWKIRNLCVAAGLNVPKKRLQVDPNKLVEKDIAVTLEDDEYDGKMKSVIASTFPLSELDADAQGDADEPKAKKGKKSKGAPQAEPVEAPQGTKGKKDKKKKGKHSVSDGELEALEVEDI